jgi:DNA repair photolyase
MIFREIFAKAILSTSQIYDHALNPYEGCGHSCGYCYAVFVKRFTGHKEKWYKFIDLKINVPELLAKENKRKRMGRVWVSGVCDPYQATEKGTSLPDRV